MGTLKEKVCDPQKNANISQTSMIDNIPKPSRFETWFSIKPYKKAFAFVQTCLSTS